ncbi:Anoctamin-8 [Blomia tropicalis]|nr:Anoctamin-8 [Blomia tropicalis]
MSQNDKMDENRFGNDEQSIHRSTSMDSIVSSCSNTTDGFQSATNSNENLLQHFQCYIMRRNRSFIRRLSSHALNATSDFDTFKRWVYQDLEKHRLQLKEAGANLFYRNESKLDTHMYDIVITFSPQCKTTLVDELQQAIVRDHPSFTVEYRKHYFANFIESALYITASEQFFEAYLQLASNGLKHSNSETCEPSPYFPCTLTCSSLQRQTIIHNILQEWRFEIDESDPTSFPILSSYIGEVPIIEKLIKVQLIQKVFPLHHEDDLDDLKESWVCKFLSSQPLDTIASYFGSSIAIYFAFIDFYTKWLLYPTFFGLFLVHFHLILSLIPEFFHKWIPTISIESNLADDILLFVFIIAMIIWASVMLQKWKIRCKHFVDRWKCLLPPKVDHFNYEEDHTLGDNVNEEHSSLNRMVFRYCVTFPIIGISLAITFAVMFNIFNFQTWWDSELIDNQSYPSWTRFVPKVMLALIINGSNFIYYYMAVWLNDKEQYSNSEVRENNLINKLVLFQFLNSFLPLLYIAFYLTDVAKLQEQLTTQLITRQVIGNFNEAVWPFVKESYRIATRKMQHRDRQPSMKCDEQQSTENNRTKASYETDDLSKGELESCMYCYESTFDDYLELVVQFGYVMLFAPVFPLAALCAFLNNLIEIRSDAFKLCYVFQRPFGNEPSRAVDEWTRVLGYLSVAAIATNCGLMVITGHINRVFGLSHSTHVILTGVAIEFHSF